MSNLNPRQFGDFNPRDESSSDTYPLTINPWKSSLQLDKERAFFTVAGSMGVSGFHGLAKEFDPQSQGKN